MARSDRERPDVTTIVVTHQNVDVVGQCMQALRGAVQRHIQEIIVVDNASTDRTAESILEHDPKATVLVLSRNVGFARANNVALHRARGRYVALVNSDCFPDSGALDLLIDAADRNPAVGLVGGTLRYGDGRHQPSAGDLPTLRSELWLALGFHRVPALRRLGVGLLFAEQLYRRSRRVGWVSGAFCLARPTIGQMPPCGFMYGEDIEWAQQATDRGFEVWLEPQASAIHLGSRSVRQSWGRSFVERQRVAFALRWFGKRGIGVLFLERLILLLHASVRLVGIAVTRGFGIPRDPSVLTRFTSLALAALVAKSGSDANEGELAAHNVEVRELSPR